MKKIATRTCIGCGEQKPKNELIRIVKNQTGEIKVDKIGNYQVEAHIYVIIQNV